MATFKLDPTLPARHVSIDPGTELRFSGSFVTSDGAVIDAATTSWADGDHPGIDAGGMVDFAGGGLRLTSRDPAAHEVVAIATGGDAPACKAAGVASPCVALRIAPLARTRLLTRDELVTSLQGQITVEHVAPPPPPEPNVAREAVKSPIGMVVLLTALAASVVFLGFTVRRRVQASPIGRLRALVKRVEQKLARADAALSVTLRPVVKKALQVIEQKKVPSAAQTARIHDALSRVEQCLDQVANNAVEARSREVADELLFEMQSALDAAAEARAI
jgi:hypothetical protein